MPTKNQLRGRTLLAIAAASGMLNSQLPAKAEGQSESKDSVIQQIANNTDLAPEARAFYLLKLANGYIDGGDRDNPELQFYSNKFDPTKNVRRGRSVLDISLGFWTDKIISEKDKSIISRTHDSSESKSVPPENNLLADNALESALQQLNRASEKIAKLKMYFIASQLYRKTGNIYGLRKCNSLLEQAFKAAERTSPVDETEVIAASSALNLLANCLIPVTIPNSPDGVLIERQTTIKPFTEEEFRESEKLKVRAIGMVDRLSPKNDVRRKTHRDLSIWYAKLGKLELAAKEKKVLFELVGFEDDGILYPQAAGCGHDVWWERQGTIPAAGCGMG